MNARENDNQTQKTSSRVAYANAFSVDLCTKVAKSAPSRGSPCNACCDAERLHNMKKK